MFKKLALLLVTASCLATVRADTITINSSASETTNNSGSPTQNISPDELWAPALAGSSWVSFANTGNTSVPGFVVVPNGTAVTFSDAFDLSGPVTAASLTVLADDTASVVVNGATIFSANLSGPFPACSATPIGCQTVTEGVFDLSELQPYLDIGSNTISFTVYQEGLVSYGLDYSGSFTVPEPGTLALLGCGLVALAFVRRHKIFTSLLSE
ncbi:MAG: PEP-CTERM sorting domain-containing protein [Candidatus Acidiferrales bacterium]